MYQFKRQFDHRKPAVKRWQIVLNLSVQIFLIAVGAFGLGVSVVSLDRTMKTGDPNGVAGLQEITVAVFGLLTLTGAFCTRVLIRRLAKLAESQAEPQGDPLLSISTPPHVTL
jgi:hypothetical protein